MSCYGTDDGGNCFFIKKFEKRIFPVPSLDFGMISSTSLFFKHFLESQTPPTVRGKGVVLPTLFKGLKIIKQLE